MDDCSFFFKRKCTGTFKSLTFGRHHQHNVIYLAPAKFFFYHVTSAAMPYCFLHSIFCCAYSV